ncbi:hypothetical protein CVV65_05525 [Kyrpidia spormannii]|uniref:Sporulation delaying protein family toxin n=1 Tax=Kyrpidia spormannii TaxID=2055160 RepID=A0A2K8N7Q6_9BACL|nr:sporulation delaying protein family toxin [Kyrpidia spormannii]ATY84482.1 hypothetical protein CVV65_05525 [Kyrpidia spormannii]
MKRIKWFIVALLSITVVAVYSGFEFPGVVKAFVLPNVEPQPKSSAHVKTHYDGKAIFQGVVFGQGPVAQLFPQYWPPTITKQANTPAAKEIVNSLLIQMEKEDPNYFRNLEAAVYSGNPQAIDAAFVSGSNLLTSAMNTMKVEANSGSVANRAVGQCVTLYVGYAVAALTVAGAINYAVLINAAGGINAYLVVFAQQYFWPKSAQPVDNATKKEMFIQQMIDTLDK